MKIGKLYLLNNLFSFSYGDEFWSTLAKARWAMPTGPTRCTTLLARPRHDTTCTVHGSGQHDTKAWAVPGSAPRHNGSAWHGTHNVSSCQARPGPSPARRGQHRNNNAVASNRGEEFGSGAERRRSASQAQAWRRRARPTRAEEAAATWVGYDGGVTREVEARRC